MKHTPKIPPVESELFHADGRTHMVGLIDSANLRTRLKLYLSQLNIEKTRMRSHAPAVKSSTGTLAHRLASCGHLPHRKRHLVGR